MKDSPHEEYMLIARERDREMGVFFFLKLKLKIWDQAVRQVRRDSDWMFFFLCCDLKYNT